MSERRPGRIRPDLERLANALDELGNPQRENPSMLIVGTNGKGSVAAMVDAVLSFHGLKTGRYTSPHLVRVEERIRVRGREISRSTLTRMVAELDRFPELTFFEALTAVAFLVFAEERVDCAVLEAGMGGRWDATRLARSEVAGLTNVGSDHASWLGNTAREIAADKGSALAAARYAVIGPQVDEALVAALGAPNAKRAAEWFPDELSGAWADDLESPFTGAHQRGNLEVAVALVHCATQAGWTGPVHGDSVREALAGVEWEGRLTRHVIAGREVLLDCAHNREAAAALAAHLHTIEGRFNMVFSCLDDKPVEEMAAVLAPAVDRVVVFPLSDERAMPIERLVAAFPGAGVAEDPIEALALLPDPVLAAGSLRLVGAMLARTEATTEIES